MLSHLYGTIVPATEKLTSSIEQYSQKNYDNSSSFGDMGYIYRPLKCIENITACRIHVAFHGCLMDIANIGESFVKETGYN